MSEAHLSLRAPINALFADLRAGRAPSLEGHIVSWVLTALEGLEALEPPTPSETDRDLFTALRGSAARVRFADLPLGTQYFLGSPDLVTDWYLPLDVRIGARPSELLRAIVTSEWTTTTMSVAQLAALMTTPFARAHYWPYADRLPHGGYAAMFEPRALFEAGKPSAPLVFLDGRPHEQCVAYALALVRFSAPDVLVDVVQGTLGVDRLHEGALPAPRYAIDQWSTSGMRPLPLGLDDPDATFEDRQLMRQWATATDRRRVARTILWRYWTLEDEDSSGDDESALFRYLSKAHDRLTDHASPYAGETMAGRLALRQGWLSPPAYADQCAWEDPLLEQKATDPVPTIRRCWTALRALFSAEGRQARFIRPAMERLRTEEVMARFEGSRLLALFPEMRDAIATLRHALDTFDRDGMSHAEALDRERRARARWQVQVAKQNAEWEDLLAHAEHLSATRDVTA
ncbi:MAG: hypothetical protein H3C62_02005 [Gemmatimonadaceae bacterium]|nr:hypothetical protein [Gemmatimonadaceae bacterium]